MRCRCINAADAATCSKLGVYNRRGQTKPLRPHLHHAHTPLIILRRYCRSLVVFIILFQGFKLEKDPKELQMKSML